MSRLGKEISRGMRHLQREADHPCFVFKSQNIPCVANEAGSSKTLGEGGFAFEADLVLFVESEDLPTPRPAEKQIITYRGRSYRIDRIGDLPGDSQVKYACNDSNKGV